MSVKEKILEHLKQGNSITALEALDLFGTMNLRNRISELRKNKNPYNIQDETIPVSGGKKHVSRYFIPREVS